MVSFDKMTIKEIDFYLKQCSSLSPVEEEMLNNDERNGAKKLLQRYYKCKEDQEKEKVRLKKMLEKEEQLWRQGYELIAGVDEAGRGPLAGPVVAAAVILKKATVIERLNDSKQLPALLREKLFEEIVIEAQSYGLGSATQEEIDRLNIHAASMLAMRRALAALNLQPDYVLVDGFAINSCSIPQKALKSGDRLSLSIAAASVLAKVTRDRMMLKIHQKYPHYGFDRNMRYGTEEHRSALLQYGPCPEHRRSFHCKKKS